MGKYDSAQKQDTDEFPIFHSVRNTGELERKQQDWFLFQSGDGRSFDPRDDGPTTDPTLPVVKSPK